MAARVLLTRLFIAGDGRGRGFHQDFPEQGEAAVGVAAHDAEGDHGVSGADLDRAKDVRGIVIGPDGIAVLEAVRLEAGADPPLLVADFRYRRRNLIPGQVVYPGVVERYALQGNVSEARDKPVIRAGEPDPELALFERYV